MEVSVFEADGLPTGSVLSVRAGSIRRQAALPLQEPLRFPNLPVNAKQFKVDVLKSLGTTRLDIDGMDSQASYTVGIDLQDGDEALKANIGFTVREEPSLCGKRASELRQVDRNLRGSYEGAGGAAARSQSYPAAAAAAQQPAPAAQQPQQPLAQHQQHQQQASADKPQRASDTREYARSHNIPNLVQEMLQYVLRERPATPYATMAEFLAKKAVENGEDLSTVNAGGLPDTGASGSQPMPVSLIGIQPDVERGQLESEHVALRAERAALLRELAELDTASLGAFS